MGKKQLEAPFFQVESKNGTRYTSYNLPRFLWASPCLAEFIVGF